MYLKQKTLFDSLAEKPVLFHPTMSDNTNPTKEVTLNDLMATLNTLTTRIGALEAKPSTSTAPDAQPAQRQSRKARRGAPSQVNQAVTAPPAASPASRQGPAPSKQKNQTKKQPAKHAPQVGPSGSASSPALEPREEMLRSYLGKSAKPVSVTAPQFEALCHNFLQCFYLLTQYGAVHKTDFSEKLFASKTNGVSRVSEENVKALYSLVENAATQVAEYKSAKLAAKGKETESIPKDGKPKGEQPLQAGEFDA